MKKVELNSEEWLSLEDLEGEMWANLSYPNYAISNYGRLKRLAHNYVPKVKSQHVYPKFIPSKMCKIYMTKRGYLTFRVMYEGKMVSIYVHREVAKAFVPNPNNYMFVNHKNENKSDNRFCNLEWCTAKYNSNYGTCQIRRASKLKDVMASRNAGINCYTLQGDLVKHYDTIGEITDDGYNLKTIYRCCQHLQETTYGYVWRYDNDSFSAPKYNDSKGGTLRHKVLQFTLDNQFIRSYDNLKEAALSLGNLNKRSGIVGNIYGKKKQAYGFIWKYAKDE